MQNADSIFGLLGPIHELPEATAQTDTFWIHNRHVPLKEKESALDDLLAQLRKVPAFNVIIKTAEILITGYIPTTADKDKSKFDFGPMNTSFQRQPSGGLPHACGRYDDGKPQPALVR